MIRLLTIPHERDIELFIQSVSVDDDVVLFQPHPHSLTDCTPSVREISSHEYSDFRDHPARTRIEQQAIDHLDDDCPLSCGTKAMHLPPGIPKYRRVDVADVARIIRTRINEMSPAGRSVHQDRSRASHPRSGCRRLARLRSYRGRTITLVVPRAGNSLVPSQQTHPYELDLVHLFHSLMIYKILRA
jgi:hypothetical protein